MDKHGSLNSETVARINCAAAHDLVERSSCFLLCGWAYREDSGITIADAMHQYIRSQCPSLASRVICQRHSRDTVGDALFSRIYLDRLTHGNPYSVKVFTTDYHVERTSEVFSFFFHNHALVSVVGAQSSKSEELMQKETQSIRAFRDTFQGAPPGDVQYALSILREKHPFYNGQIYEPIGKVDDVQLGLLIRAESQ